MIRIALVLYTALVVANTNFVYAQPVIQSQKTTYKNPLPVELGDPYVLHVKGDKYYMYGTGGGAKHGFSAYSSTDLVDWKKEGQVYFGNNKNGWGSIDKAWDGAYWAPEVYEVKGRYYMFYSANGIIIQLMNWRTFALVLLLPIIQPAHL